MVPVAHAAAGALRAAVEHDGAVRVERDRCEPELRQLPDRARHRAGADRAGARRDAAGRRDGARRPHRRHRLVHRRGPAAVRGAGRPRRPVARARPARAPGPERSADRARQPHAVPAPGRGVAGARRAGMATVLFLDLDDFKAINDRAGHAAGDAVLVAAAGRIEASVRPGDVAARMGGDEFAVLLEDVDDHHGEQVAGRILDLLAEPVVVDGEELWVRSSVGIATAAAGLARLGRAAAPRRRGDVPRQGGRQEPDARLVPGDARRPARALRRAATSWPTRCGAASWSPTSSRSCRWSTGARSRPRRWRAGATRGSGCWAPARSCPTPRATWRPPSTARCSSRPARRRRAARCRRST